MRRILSMRLLNHDWEIAIGTYSLLPVRVDKAVTNQ